MQRSPSVAPATTAPNPAFGRRTGSAKQPRVRDQVRRAETPLGARGTPLVCCGSVRPAKVHRTYSLRLVLLTINMLIDMVINRMFDAAAA